MGSLVPNFPYGNRLAQSEQAFKALWEKLAQNDGEIRVQWRVIQNRTSLDLYRADLEIKNRSARAGHVDATYNTVTLLALLFLQHSIA